MSLKYNCWSFPLDLLPIIFPSKMFVTKSLCLFRCPMSFIFLFIIVVTMFFSSPISCKIVFFFFLFIQVVLVVFLQIHISITFNFSCSYFFMAHVSHLYNKILEANDYTELFLVLMLQLLFNY